MQLVKNLSQKKRALLTLTTCAMIVVIFFYVASRIWPKNASVPLTADNNIGIDANTSQGFPVRLKIPSINIDANVLSVGLTSSGEMDTPKGPSDVAWFNLGKRPGENGSSVITGHYGTWKTGGGSVFDNLNKLTKGDKISVEDETGAITTFVVRESRSYDPESDATNVFSSDDDKSHLNLITCEGTWSNDAKSYSQRLVVFADKE